MCFIDFEKTFDRVQHDPLFPYLDEVGLDNYDFRLLKHLYYNQVASIEVDNTTTQEITFNGGTTGTCWSTNFIQSLFGENISRINKE